MRTFSIIVCCIFLSFPGCRVHNPDAAEYWKNSIQLNEELEKELSKEFRILQGMLDPKEESELYPIDEENLYLAVEGYREVGKWKVSKVRSTSPDREFTSRTVFTKTSWEDEELYEVHRRQIARIGYVSPSITWEGIARLISKGPEGTSTQDFLCKSMDCSEEITPSGKTLSYTLSEKTKKTYPAFYKKFSKRLSILDFECKGIPDSNSRAAILVTNRNSTILIHLPPASFSRSWRNPRNLNFTLNLTIRSYGIILSIQDMKYILTYQRSGNTESLSGRFLGIPESKIEGRFFYIIPQGLVNLFIPSDIESYLKKGIQLITVGSDGKKGNRFTVRYGGRGKGAYYDLSSSSEVYRKRFSLLGERKQEEEEGTGNQKVFFRDFIEAIRLDLAGNLAEKGE